MSHGDGTALPDAPECTQTTAGPKASPDRRPRPHPRVSVRAGVTSREKAGPWMAFALCICSCPWRSSAGRWVWGLRTELSEPQQEELTASCRSHLVDRSHQRGWQPYPSCCHLPQIAARTPAWQIATALLRTVQSYSVRCLDDSWGSGIERLWYTVPRTRQVTAEPRNGQKLAANRHGGPPP